MAELEARSVARHLPFGVTITLVTALVAGLGLVAPSVSSASSQARGTIFASDMAIGLKPKVLPNFWSAILRIFITISRHAAQQMAARNVSNALLKQILNEGRVIAQKNGVTTIRMGQVTVHVSTSTGNVITVIRAGGGGGGV